MQRKFNFAFVFLTYSGNGGFANHCVDIRRWWGDTLLKLKTDPGISPFVGEISDSDPCDTPVPMVRNAAVQAARGANADILVMVDSDQAPDKHLGEPGTRPFFESSFEFLRNHYDKGPCVIGAPYCGPPPHENVYVFKWANIESDDPNCGFSLAQFDREHAAVMAGIQEVAALPTGLIMFDMRIFDMLEPPYFAYEYSDVFESKKASTEDVVTTRDMSLVCERQLGYNPVLCNFDAWAGHHKPKCVGKPRILASDVVSERLVEAANRGIKRNDRLVQIKDGLPDWSGACPEKSPTPQAQKSRHLENGCARPTARADILPSPKLQKASAVNLEVPTISLPTSKRPLKTRKRGR